MPHKLNQRVILISDYIYQTNESAKELKVMQMIVVYKWFGIDS